MGARLFGLTFFVLVALVVAKPQEPLQGESIQGEGTVYYNRSNGDFWLVMGKVDKDEGVAVGYWVDNILSDGWGRLTIQTNHQWPDELQTFAAGFFEGATTWERIYQHYINIYSSFFGNMSATVPPKLRAWLTQQDKWVRDQCRVHGHRNHYWGQVAAIVAQFDGLVTGYNKYASKDKQLDPLAFTILNGVGDLLDLTNAFKSEIKPKRPQSSHMTAQDWQDWVRNTHCSALIKITGDLSDLFAGHTSWFWYSSMLRIAKTYVLALNNPMTAAKAVTFSSYPGFLESLDDFYITDQELVVIETSNGVFNDSLYALVRGHPNVLLSWQRTLLANRVASTGPEWAQAYSLHNSGTYNNQWLVLDNKKFVPRQPLPHGLLIILEQIPGYIEWSDQTRTLERGYWPSYNVPFFEKIYNMSGYLEQEKNQPIMLSYQTCCRANIYRRDQGTVDSLDTFKHILRYNDWQHDPYSEGHAGYSISSRFDLEKTNPAASGGIDTKVTSHQLIKQMVFEAINGPTYQQQPVFEWTTQFHDMHVGQPNRFDFPFVLMKPHKF
jgi:hypothetical protein